jgi:membrane associated rhomboid family serine protease
LIPLKDSNPTERFPLITVLLIAINTGVFLFEMSLGEHRVQSFIAAFALVPAALLQGHGMAEGLLPPSVTVVTSMFLHGGLFHVAGNMLYLWIFGNNVEDAMGRARFIVFYLLCGLAAALSHAALNPASTVPMIGASGAISGVLGAYMLLYPRARVLTLFILGFFVKLIEVPAVAVLGFWFIFQFLYVLVAPSSGGGVAWMAHVGGFVSGMAFIGIFKRSAVPWGGGRRTGSL